MMGTRYLAPNPVLIRLSILSIEETGPEPTGTMGQWGGRGLTMEPREHLQHGGVIANQYRDGPGRGWRRAPGTPLLKRLVKISDL